MAGRQNAGRTRPSARDWSGAKRVEPAERAVASVWSREYDVILPENMFGDILPDEIPVPGGWIGLLPHAVRAPKHRIQSDN